MVNLFRLSRMLFGYIVAGIGAYIALVDVKPFVIVPFFAGVALVIVAAMIAHPDQAIPAFGYCMSGVVKLWPFGKKSDEHEHRRRHDAAPHHHKRQTPTRRVTVSDFTISDPQLPVEDPRERGSHKRRPSDG